MARDMVRVPGGTSGARYGAPTMRLGRSQFDLSHNHKTTFDAGFLIPYLLLEIVPGDTVVCKLEAFARIFSPLVTPIMDNIRLEIDYFFVPNRILWTNWAKFLGASDAAGEQTTDYVVPTVNSATIDDSGSYDHLLRYMGVPWGLNTGSTRIQALPLRAYQRIYNEWYRDQNLIAKYQELTDNGPDALSYYGVRKSAKRPDYFTTALPYLQKGDAGSIPLSGDVRADLGTGGYPSVYSTTASQYRQLGEDGGGTSQLLSASASAATKLYVDMPAITINALREAAAIQRLLEKDARSGTRYPEKIYAHFGVDVPDYRSQRPEYLGGGSGWLHVTPIANTSDTATADQGQLAGVGAGTLSGGFAKSFVEHGYVIGMLRARGDVTYQQGLERHWSRETRLDFLWPEFANLGEQEILNKELFVTNTSADDDVFGYQERYADYRYKKSLVTGKFQSDATGSIDIWHLAEDFASAPALNQTFIEDQTPMERVQAVTDEFDFIIDGRFDLKVARALPVRPTPSLAPARF